MGGRTPGTVTELLVNLLATVHNEKVSTSDVAEAVLEAENLVIGGPRPAQMTPQTCALYMEILATAALRLAEYVVSR